MKEGCCISLQVIENALKRGNHKWNSYVPVYGSGPLLSLSNGYRLGDEERVFLFQLVETGIRQIKTGTGKRCIVASMLQIYKNAGEQERKVYKKGIDEQ